MHAALEERKDNRAQVLGDFLQYAQQLDLREDNAFQGMLRKGQELLELSDQEMADALLVSRPTVNRWIRGKNLPHQALRKPVNTWIVEQLTQRIKRLKAIGRSAA